MAGVELPDLELNFFVECNKMPSLFPGMDPFLERPEIWPDFHDRLITYICEALQPVLRPQYVALTQDRLFVVENNRPIRPEVSIFEVNRGDVSAAGTITLVADPATTVVEFQRDEIRQPYIEIIEPASGNQVVTAIEVLSPDNKAPGVGLKSYQQKQDELWAGGANLIEIDLWSQGTRIPRVDATAIGADLHRRYLVTVSRVEPRRCEFYGIDLPQRLPRISVPLKPDDKDVMLDLQAVFQRCYDSGPYPQLLYYDRTPPAPLDPAESEFVRKLGLGLKE